MSVAKLQNAITEIANAAEAEGKQQLANDVRCLGELIEGPPDRSADNAISEITALLDAEKRRAIEDYVKRLTRVGTDRAAFEAVFSELSEDQSILKDDADAIAHGYVQGRSKWPSRKAALEAIRKIFQLRAYSEAKMRIVERSKVW